jgi:hypothetical protein
MSVAPPGENGTTRRTGFVGHACAWTSGAEKAPAANMQAANVSRKNERVMQLSPW